MNFSNVEGSQDKLTDLRTRVDRINEDADEQFNEHTPSFLEIFEHLNIERTGIERRENEVHDGRWKVTCSVFDLHIVRATDRPVYWDSVDLLSEVSGGSPG